MVDARVGFEPLYLHVDVFENAGPVRHVLKLVRAVSLFTHLSPSKFSKDLDVQVSFFWVAYPALCSDQLSLNCLFCFILDLELSKPFRLTFSALLLQMLLVVENQTFQGGSIT